MTKRKGPTPPRRWQPLERRSPTDPAAFARSERPGATMWANDRYVVIVNPLDPGEGMAGMVWLSIRRQDRKPLHDWRDLQRIKNDVAGDEREAVELYPAESRLVDTSNQYHLWVFPAGVTVGFGFQQRSVFDGQNLEVDGQVLTPSEIDEHLAEFGHTRDDIAKARQRAFD